MADERIWYESILQNGLRRNLGISEITESNPLDWERLRILKNGKLVPAMNKGHKGKPSQLDLDILYAEAQKGNLFVYRMGEIYPQHLVGDVWYSTNPDVKENDKKTNEHYDNLSMEIKGAIRDEMNQRKDEIFRNEESKRVAVSERRVQMDWYRNQFMANIVQPRSDKELQATDGIDWTQVRIWDGTKFTSPVPEGFKGSPTNEMIQTLKDAVEKGNLFMYRAADRYPSKWMGKTWCSMDKNWIDSLKPTLVEPPLPKQPMQVEPQEKSYMKGVSSRKLALNRFFGRFGIQVYVSELYKYNDRRNAYIKDLDEYQEKLRAFDRAMVKYNEEKEIRQNIYDQKLRTYEGMMKYYNTLTSEQKAAMESELPRRDKEIQQRREKEKARANELTKEQREKQAQLTNAEKRIDTLAPKPQAEQFVGGKTALGQNVYETIAPNGYDLPEGSLLTAKDAAVIHIALAGSAQAAVNQGLSPLSEQRYSQMMDGILYGDLDMDELKYISASYNAAKNYIGTYAKGEPKPLAEAMSGGLRNLINVSRGRLGMNAEMAGIAKVIERMLDVLDKDPNLLQNCTLSEAEMKYARGLAALGKEFNKFMEAQIGLTNEATGAHKHTKEELVTQTVDLFTGKAIDSHLKNAPEETKQQTVTQMGGVEGTSLDTVKKVLTQNPEIQKVSTQPELLHVTDMDKRGMEVGKVVQNTNLKEAREDQQLSSQVTREVKESLQVNGPEAKERKYQMDQKQKDDLTLARGVLAQKNPELAEIDLEDQRVKEMLSDLKEAQKNLEQQSRAKNREPEALALNDPKIVQEAALRSEVRKLMEEENKTAKFKMKIMTATVNTRISALERVQKQLGGELSLTDPRVVNAERTSREKDSKKLFGEVNDRVHAQEILRKEGGAAGLDKKDAWKTDERVQKRLKELRDARTALGREFEDLPLNDMRVIKQDYKDRGINPLWDGGIVDVTDLSKEDRKEYDERMQTIDSLKQGKNLFVYTIHDKAVLDRMKELRDARVMYESIEGAQKDLALDDPKIQAMRVLNEANGHKEFGKKWTTAEIDTVAKELQGKNSRDRKLIGEHSLKLHNEGKEVGQNIKGWNNLNSNRLKEQQQSQKVHVPGIEPK